MTNGWADAATPAARLDALLESAGLEPLRGGPEDGGAYGACAADLPAPQAALRIAAEVPDGPGALTAGGTGAAWNGGAVHLASDDGARDHWARTAAAYGGPASGRRRARRPSRTPAATAPA
ncbi:hypothetical protein [Streptomyces sp. NPDC003090]|uniref:hypothetical protein n=1 Tax=Streptomyces sp. NPDC003090 TaxID=3154274 RepID=UPI0037F35E6C